MKQYVVNQDGELSYEKPPKGKPYVALPKCDDVPAYHYWRIIWPDAGYRLVDLQATITEPSPPMRIVIYERVVVDDEGAVGPVWEWALASYD